MAMAPLRAACIAAFALSALTGCGLRWASSDAGFVPLVAAAKQAIVTVQDQRGRQGTGFFVCRGGLVISNAHLLTDDTAIGQLSDGSRHPITVLTRDEALDIAIARLPVSDAACLPLRASSAAAGESVVALGNPFGLGITVSAGIISARGDDVGKPGLLLTDAAINPGNSGGPLLDVRGRVVGLVSARASFGTGVGFAVDVQRLEQAIQALDPVQSP